MEERVKKLEGDLEKALGRLLKVEEKVSIRSQVTAEWLTWQHGIVLLVGIAIGVGGTLVIRWLVGGKPATVSLPAL